MGGGKDEQAPAVQLEPPKSEHGFDTVLSSEVLLAVQFYPTQSCPNPHLHILTSPGSRVCLFITNTQFRSQQMTHFCHQMAIPGHFTLMAEWDPETPNSLAGVWRNQEATSGWVPPQHLVHGKMTREVACWRAKVEDMNLGCSVPQHPDRALPRLLGGDSALCPSCARLQTSHVVTCSM